MLRAGCRESQPTYPERKPASFAPAVTFLKGWMRSPGQQATSPESRQTRVAGVFGSVLARAAPRPLQPTFGALQTTSQRPVATFAGATRSSGRPPRSCETASGSSAVPESASLA